MKRERSYHVPVMVDEVLGYLRPERGGLFLDGTLGGGGHAEAILARGREARLVAVDRDPDALGSAMERLAPFEDRVRLIHSNFADAIRIAGVEPGTLAGALLDLGISSHQIDADERGFTFRPGAVLDMRMDGAEEERSTAADLLNESSEEELVRIFRTYGEEPRARKLARTVVERRDAEPFRSSDDLLEAIARTLGPRSTAQDRARIFQALRIAVNGEIEALERALPEIRDALSPGGVFVVLSYHSLEDRLVKDSFREWSRTCVCPPRLPICHCRGVPLGELLTRKAVFAGADEIGRNVRARSARLRAWRRG
jgi:16S rRNA (cytosine1402-N4)-methyltransferase